MERFANLSIEQMLALLDGKSEPEIAKQFAPAALHRDATPDEKLKEFMAGLNATPQGRLFFNWLLNLTCNAPYPDTGLTMEVLAFAAAKHQARAAIGEAIMFYITQGDALIENRKNQKDAQK